MDSERIVELGKRVRANTLALVELHGDTSKAAERTRDATTTQLVADALLLVVNIAVDINRIAGALERSNELTEVSMGM